MFDFCINGGGMVGSALALGLVKQGYRVALVETVIPEPFAPEQPPDLRLSAISLASVELLSSLGAWEYIDAMRLRPYSKLSVWESPDARTDFDAQLLGRDKLGYFVENRLIQLGCLSALDAYGKDENAITLKTGVKIVSFTRKEGATEVHFNDGESLQCHYLIGADGAGSFVREHAGIASSGWQYRQQAMGIIITCDKPVPEQTWQQFYPSGPRALLPMYGNHASLIWYDDKKSVERLKKLPHAQLKAEIDAAFPHLSTVVTDYSILSHAAFGLSRSHASSYVMPGVILVGDAAHTINPLAGQGVNLGFKDVATLLSVTETYAPASSAFFRGLQNQYEKPRRRDNLMMMSAMDAFYFLFSTPILPVKVMRESLLKVAQQVTPAKREVLKYAAGLS